MGIILQDPQSHKCSTEKLADDIPQTNPPMEDELTDQQEEITDHICQMDERMGHQENKINTLTNTTEKIMELVQKISKNTAMTVNHPPATVTAKPMYASMAHPAVPARHMEVIR